MSRYRKIDPRIWNDAKFSSLSDRAKLVFFMLLTHPNMTALGAMRATLSGLAEELGWEPEAFREAFREASQKGMAEHDQKACLVALPNFIKYNPPESPNVIKAWSSALDLLPECSLKTRVTARAKAFAESMTEGFAKALPEAFSKGMPYQEQEQEQEYSVPDGTGAAAPPPLTLSQPGEAPAEKPPPDPIFGTGLELLVGKGVTDRSARSFLGLLRRDVGDLVTGELLAEVERQDITDPIPWLRKAAESRKQSPTKRGGMVRAGSKDYGVGPNGEF